MNQTQAIMTLVISLITTCLGGGLTALILLPKQRRQLDANTAKIVVDAAAVLVDQLQEESTAAKTEARSAKNEAIEARAEVAGLRAEIANLRREVTRLTADLEDRDRTIAKLRRVRGAG